MKNKNENLFRLPFCSFGCGAKCRHIPFIYDFKTYAYEQYPSFRLLLLLFKFQAKYQYTYAYKLEMWNKCVPNVLGLWLLYAIRVMVVSLFVGLKSFLS